MVLSGQAIVTGGLISTVKTLRVRDASCDLTVGAIVDPQGKEVGEYVVPPQGIVRIVSEETLKIDAEHLAYVHVKTSLCNRGILALNIGIVDPGFDGPLGSTLINFGKTPYMLHEGEVFGRLTVHKIIRPNVTPATNLVSRSDAKRLAQSYVLDYLSDSFLNLAKTTEETAKKVFDEYKTVIIKYVPVFAFGLALLVFLLNFSNLWITQAYIKPNEYAQTVVASAQLQKMLESIAAQQDALRAEVSALKIDFAVRQDAVKADVDVLRAQVDALKLQAARKP